MNLNKQPDNARSISPRACLISRIILACTDNDKIVLSGQCQLSADDVDKWLAAKAVHPSTGTLTSGRFFFARSLVAQAPDKVGNRFLTNA